jgi:transposase InsO family protein
VKYACIAEHREAFPVRLMCRVLSVSPAGFYAAQRRRPSARARQDVQLTLHIRAVHAQSQRRYGAPLIYRALQAQGIPCGRHRVARLMQAEGLRATRARKFRVPSRTIPPHPIAPNTLARRFAPAQWPARDRAWVSDITYLWTREGWLYLAVVLDLASRRVVGWACAPRLDRTLALTALQRAITTRRPPPGLLHHSDRGGQYACREYQERLATAAITPSMSRAADCWDNAVAESFFATLKGELADGAHWATRREARTALFDYLEIWYNRQRRHSSLGYRSPVQYEADVLRRAAA